LCWKNFSCQHWMFFLRLFTLYSARIGALVIVLSDSWETCPVLYPGLWSSHHRLRIWTLHSVIRVLAIAALPWMLDLWSSHRVREFLWKQGLNIQVCCPVTCAAVVLWFFKTILLSVRRSLSVSVDSRPLFLFADVFPWFVYADITSETVSLHTPNHVAVFVTDAPGKRAPTIWPLSKSGKSHIYDSFTRTLTQHNH
jgi:hypothetical protein